MELGGLKARQVVNIVELPGKKMIRFGLIGLASKTNGHPFSYASIINGVNLKTFPKEEWSVIYDYLKTKHFSETGINGANVTHVCTQIRLFQKHLVKPVLLKI